MNELPRDLRDIIHRYIRDYYISLLHDDHLSKTKMIRYGLDMMFNYYRGTFPSHMEIKYFVCKSCKGWFMWSTTGSEICMACNNFNLDITN